MSKKAKVQKAILIPSISDIREKVRRKREATLAKLAKPITKANVGNPVKPTKAQILWDLAHQAKIKNSITVGALIEQLKVYPAELKVYFGGLDFYQLKRTGDKTIQVEFAQNVYMNKRRKIVIDELKEKEK